tara:strand:+ start:479 stop:652 length:174 start_codon:yes stop_codon:yes gene_type:complete
MKDKIKTLKNKEKGEKTMVGALLITAVAFGLMFGFVKVVSDPFLNGTIVNGNTVRRS